MATGSRVSGLFRGTKPRSLWGGAPKDERSRYKQIRGMRLSKPERKVSLAETYLRINSRYHAHLKEALDSFLAGNARPEMFERIGQDLKGIRDFGSQIPTPNSEGFHESREGILLQNIYAKHHERINIPVAIGDRLLEGYSKGNLTKDDVQKMINSVGEVSVAKLDGRFFDENQIRKEISRALLRRPKELNEQIDTIVFTNTKMLEARGVKVQVSANSAPSPVIASEFMFGTFRKFLSIAASRTPSGGVIKVKGKVAGGMTIISIEDKGTVQKRVSDPTVSAIREILVDAGGKMQITSKPGVGTKVTLIIPNKVKS